MSRCAALSAAADTPLSRAAVSIGLHGGLVALGGGVARGGEQPLVQIVVEARDEFGRGTRFAQMP